MGVSWRLSPLSQHRLAGMPPETSPRKDRAVAMATADQASATAAAEAVGLGPEEAGGGQSSSQVRSTSRCLSTPSLAKLFCAWRGADADADADVADDADLDGDGDDDDDDDDDIATRERLKNDGAARRAKGGGARRLGSGGKYICGFVWFCCPV